MGKNKRKREETTTEDLLRKLRKLEKKIENRIQQPSAPPAPFEPASNTNSICDSVNQDRANELEIEEINSPIDIFNYENSEYIPEDFSIEEFTTEQDQIRVQSVVSVPIVELNTEIIPSTSTQEKNPADPNELATAAGLPPEILSVLGESKKPKESVGKKIPPEISERWGKIILEGLAKDAKEDLLSKTLIPENFQLAKAPKLNEEVASIVNDSTKNRDKRLEKTQNQLGSAISRVVSLTTDLIESDMNKLDIIKNLSEINQILLDLHNEETLNRRRLILPLLDNRFWNIIKDVRRDEYLFGDHLGDNIKSSKSIEKSSQLIKRSIPTLNSRRLHQPGNSRLPPRQPQAAARQAPLAHAPPPPLLPQPARYHREPPPLPPARRPITTARGRGAPAYRNYDRRTRH